MKSRGIFRAAAAGFMLAAILALASSINASMHVKLVSGSESKIRVVSLNSTEPIRFVDIPLLTPVEICNPEIATQYGIKGYIKISVPPGTPEVVTVRRGESVNVTLLLRFVSYFSNFTEVEVILDPYAGRDTIEQCYVSEVNGTRVVKSIMVNDLITYDPSGTVTLKANQTLPVTMTVTIPEDFPLITFPLGAVGISSDIDIIDWGYMQCSVYP